MKKISLIILLKGVCFDAGSYAIEILNDTRMNWIWIDKLDTTTFNYTFISE